MGVTLTEKTPAQGAYRTCAGEATKENTLNDSRGRLTVSFKTDVQTMNNAANNVDRINGDVQGELGRLQGVVQDVAASWKGDAQNSFAGLMERWNDNARELRNALSSISDNLRANASGFDEAEAQNAAAFNA